MTSAQLAAKKKGPLAWFANNSVAANVIMLVLLIGGAVIASQVREEVFPEVQFEVVVVNIPYPGASPSEVEKGVVLVTEEAIRSVEGIKEINATATEGMGVVWAELLDGHDPDRGLADIKSAVDRVTSFPADVERPTVFLASNRRRVVSVAFYGDAEEASLRQAAEDARDRLLQDDRVSTVELSAVRQPEISIEITPESVRQYGLTPAAIAARIRAAAVELPAGAVKTDGGEVLIRTAERREYGSEFESIVLLARPDGTEVRVRDVATVRDGFQESDREAYFNGRRAAMLDVYRVGEETPLDISAAVEEFIEKERAGLPAEISISKWSDSSELYEGRINLLKNNAFWGLLLVMLTLGLFLEIRLAFWVTLGIPISFVGAFLFLPAVDVSINMISLFAFIVVLGLVVDDAIVVGEAIYYNRQRGMGRLEAAIAGVREVAVPVTFAIITTIFAFMPMLFVPGFAGKFFRNIPWVVIAVLLVSLIEGLIILPAHLAHSKPPSERGIFGFIHHQQQRFSRMIEWLIEKTYVPTIAFAARRRYLALSIGVAMLIGTAGLIAGGRVGFVFMPKIESDTAVAAIELPFGSPVKDTNAIRERMERTLQESLDALGGKPEHVRGIFSQTGASTQFGGGPGGGSSRSGGHIAEVGVNMVPIDERPFRAMELIQEWRGRLGEIPGVEALAFKAETGGSGDAPVGFDLTHSDSQTLEAAAAELAGVLSTYGGVFDVADGFEAGKQQLDLKLKPAARAAGLTEAEVGRQIRSYFFGAEALRQQRGRDEVRVYVRYPREARSSEAAVENLLLQTPQGSEIPLAVAADIERGHSYTSIRRKESRRVARVTADVDFSVTNANAVTGKVIEKEMPGLMARYPGLSWELGGEQQHQAETMSGLRTNFGVAMLAIFALLAMAFRSYVQPVIIMAAIPFGIVGAVGGHVLMGYDLSLMSMMGVVALSGVVVNDSLILIVAINQFRKEGMGAAQAVVAGGQRRFRPIILTSLTTFFGLAPMILETSVQARFLIPMAISLGFGVIFATFITLVLVPVLYMILEDFRVGIPAALKWLKEGPRETDPATSTR